MAKVFIEESTLTKIGNSIRAKTGKTELIDPAVMDVEIESITTGGGEGIPEEAFNITGDCPNLFANGKWDWFITNYGSQIKTSSISNLEGMFQYCQKLTKIPFTINVKSLRCYNMFYNDVALTEPPHINIEVDKFSISNTNLQYMIASCSKLSNVENLFNAEQIETIFSNHKATSYSTSPNLGQIFYSCLRLRQIPSWWYKFKLSDESTYVSTSYNMYYSAFRDCYLLDEVVNIPIVCPNVAVTSNLFNATFNGTRRLKNLTFKTNSDGSPFILQWKGQTIDCANYCGYNSTNLTTYGMSASKQVKDDATYQALKDDPDWWSTLTEYARYNHDSAVATINSLPDTSAYLASAGGTNTIKFKGAAGSLTDGGAINTLTEEEIAVATAKGWTVTLA